MIETIKTLCVGLGKAAAIIAVVSEAGKKVISLYEG